MKELLYSLKVELKALAEAITIAKKSRKKLPCGYVPGLADLQFRFRIKHIYRCLLRGKTLDQIENSRIKNPPDPNSWNEKLIHIHLKDLEEKYSQRRKTDEQALCANM